MENRPRCIQHLMQLPTWIRRRWKSLVVCGCLSLGLLPLQVLAGGNSISQVHFEPQKNQLTIATQSKVQKVRTHYFSSKKQYVIELGNIHVSSRVVRNQKIQHAIFKRIMVQQKNKKTKIILQCHRKEVLKFRAQPSQRSVRVTWQRVSRIKKNSVKNLTLKSTLAELMELECKDEVSEVRLFYANEQNRIMIDIPHTTVGRGIKRYWNVQNDILESVLIRQYKKKVRVIINFSEADSAAYKVYTEDNRIMVVPKFDVVLGRALNELVDQLRFKTDMNFKYARDFKRDDNYEASRDIRLLLEGSAKYSWGMQNFIKAGVRYRFVEEYEPGFFTLSDTRFGETYLNLVGDFYHIGLGYQTVRWGRTDEYSPMDVINPEDLTEFHMNARPERKIPVPILRLGWLADWFKLEGVYVPWFTPAKVIFRDSDWALFDHAVEDLTSQLSPWGERLRDLNFVENDLAGSFLEKREGGLRFTKSFNQFDLGLTYYYGWDKTPTVHPRTGSGMMMLPLFFDPQLAPDYLSTLSSLFFLGLSETDLTYDLRYHRYQLYGFDMEATVWDIGLRCEVVWFEDRVFQQQTDLELVKKDQLHYVVGFDYFIWENVYINMLFSHARILEFEQDLLFVEEDQMDLAGTFSWKVIADELTMEATAGYHFGKESIFLKPVAIWHQSDNLEIEFGCYAMFPHADATTILSDKNNQLFINGCFHF